MYGLDPIDLWFVIDIDSFIQADKAYVACNPSDEGYV
jgi:hypothetical protein